MPDKERIGAMHAATLAADTRENRRHDRLRLETEVRYKVVQRRRAPSDGAPQGFRPDGRSVDISLRGLCIVTDEALRKGEYLKLELGLPGRSAPVQALAEVVWTAAKGARHASGIRFLILLNRSDDALIREFVESRLSADPE